MNLQELKKLIEQAELFNAQEKAEYSLLVEVLAEEDLQKLQEFFVEFERKKEFIKDYLLKKKVAIFSKYLDNFEEFGRELKREEMAYIEQKEGKSNENLLDKLDDL